MAGEEPRIRGAADRQTALPPGATGAVALLVALVAAACPARREGPELPELTEESHEVARRTSRTREIHQVMARDLEAIRQLAEKLGEPPRELFDRDFPLDLFKHVAVECLNAPTVDGDEEEAREDAGLATADANRTSSDVGALTSTLQCPGRFIERLDARLRRLPADDRSRAREMLRHIDQFHQLRVRLRRRLAKIESVVESNRDLIASRRANLRKMRAQWERRRAELRRERWETLQKQFDALEKDLKRLQRETRRLESAAGEWPDVVDRANYRVYFAITSEWEPAE